MPWFQASCDCDVPCLFTSNFEAEGIEEARILARKDHSAFSPDCAELEEVESSDIEVESFDTTHSAERGGNPFGGLRPFVSL